MLPRPRMNVLSRERVLERERGFTLVEMMAAVVITLVVVAAGFTILTTTTRATQANDHAVATQQNARAAMELLARDIKVAGFGFVGPIGACSTAIVPGDNNVGGADTGPDRVSVVVPKTRESSPAWALAQIAKDGFNTITLQSGAVLSMTEAGLAPNSVISLNGAATGTVSSVSTGSSTITLQAPSGTTTAVPSPALFAVGTPVFLLECVTYQVIRPPDSNNVCGGSAPCLVRGITTGGNCDVASSPCGPVVDGIEDLQLAYACDGCVSTINGGIADHIIDDRNGSNSFDSGDFVTDSAWVTAPLVPSSIRLVQITVVSRQTAEDLGTSELALSTTTVGPVQVSDHNPIQDGAYYNVGTYQKFRRRTLTRTIETRNIGQS